VSVPGTPSSKSISLETITLIGRLKGTRGLSLYVLMLVAAPVLWVVSARAVAADLASVDIGLDTQRRPFVAPRVGYADDRWPGAKRDDVILSVNGTPTTDSFSVNNLRRELSPGTVTLVFQRGDERFERTAQTTPRTLGYRAALLVRLASGALLLLLGLAAFLLRPGTKVSWLFLLFCFSFAVLALLISGVFSSAELFFGIVMPTMCIAVAIGGHLFGIFPRRARAFEKWPGLERAFYVPSAILAVAAEYGLLVERNPERWLLWSEAAIRLWMVLFAIGFGSTLIYERRRARQEGQDRIVSQYNLLMWAVFGGVLVPASVTTVIRLLRSDSWVGDVGVATTVVFAVLTAWAMVRHNPLDVDRYAASVVGYTMTIGVLGVLFAGVLAGMPFALSALGLAHSSEALVAVTAGVVLAFGPLYRTLKRRVDVWFSREQADALQTTRALRELAERVQSLPRDQALAVAVETALVMHTDAAQLWLMDKEGTVFEPAARKDAPGALPAEGTAAPAGPLQRQGPLGGALLSGTGGVGSLSPVPFPLPAQEELWARGLSMAAPVRAHGALVGFLAVGRKRSGFSWRDEELAFLSAVAAQAGAVLERSEVLARIGRYRVEKRLAVGGMAEVFLAWQMGEGGFERKVALKRLLPDLAEDPRFTAMLLDEARIASRLSHRHIAQVLDVGKEGDQYFIAMEFVDGPALRRLLAWGGRTQQHVPLPIALAVADTMLSALDYAHALADEKGQPLNIVHRDVTPQNVLLTLRGEVKLVDFGLARASTRQFRTETGVVRGTLPYMSPEQAQQGPIDLRTDVYAAGATLYELFTGHRAFPGGPTGELPARPSSLRANLTAAFDAVLLKAMAAEAPSRWATAGQLRQALMEAALPERPASDSETANWLQRVLVELPEAAAAPAPKAASTPEDRTATRKVEPPPVR
jgi:hypothetical protein